MNAQAQTSGVLPSCQLRQARNTQVPDNAQINDSPNTPVIGPQPEMEVSTCA